MQGIVPTWQGSVPPRIRSPKAAVDHQGFLRIVQEVVALQIQSEQAAPRYQPTVVEDFPKENLGKADSPFDVIVYHVVSSETAGQAPDGTRKPKGLTLREERPSQTEEGYVDQVIGWQELATVQFTVYAKDNKRANDLCAWFHSMMMRWGLGFQYFRTNGVELFRFHRRLEDKKELQFGQDLYIRGLQYQVRLEFIDLVKAKTLEFIQVNISESLPSGRNEIESLTLTSD